MTRKTTGNKKEEFRSDAKIITDMLFDTKCFRDDLTRDQLNALEDYIQSTMNSRFDTYLFFDEINKKLTKNDTKN